MVDGCVPKSLAEALETRKSRETTVVAGGTDLMVRYRRHTGLAPRLPNPPLFVGELSELRGIEAGKTSIRIGAAARLSEIGASSEAPGYLRTILASFASPAIRNAGTMGGNLCNASPAGDTIPALYAADAECVLASTAKTRIVPVSDFVTGPGGTLLGTDEILTEIRIPVQPEPWRFLYRKVGPRKANALSKLSVLVLWKGTGGMVTDCRIAIGGAAPTVVRPAAAESAAVRFLSGEPGNGGALAEALEAVGESISPIDDQRSTAGYRRRTITRIVEEFLHRITISIEEE